ncbi:MauE/DoxX family redox-associated membrane protein [Actinomadura sp. 21ATH]|uniref:MauE/DoxX family redox-associated membrane protein n=1 Tax=Actinomadura sp. 21ATH TaxID=1735444 RepID=UPI0035BF6E0B
MDPLPLDPALVLSVLGDPMLVASTLIDPVLIAPVLGGPLADDIANAQVLLLAGVLLTACLAKLVFRAPVPAAPAHVHGVPVPGRLRRATALRQDRRANVGLGAAEGVLGLALLITPHLAVRLATIAVFAAATWAVGELRVRRPDAGCGCFGGLSTKQIGHRTVLRAVLLTAAAVVSLDAPHAGLTVLLDGPSAAGAVLLAELALFAALSPEIAVLLGRTRPRLRPVTPCERRRSPLAETYARLRESDAWRESENAIVSAVPLDVWREGCWRFVVYPAHVDGRDTELVFAVSTAERGHTVRVAAVPPATPALPATL